MVQDLWNVVGKHKQSVDISTLRNKRIAINGHQWIWEIMRGNVAYSSTILKPYLCAFYNRCKALISCGIEPLIVFDNVDDQYRHDPHNNMVLKKDRRDRSGAWSREVLSEIVDQINEIKSLLKAMSVRHMPSSLESDAQCAQLEKRGLVQGCITRSIDYILYGGLNLYQVEFSQSGRSVHKTVLTLSMNSIVDIFHINRSAMIAMGFLIGCDYFVGGIPGVGSVAALEILSEFYIMNQDHPQVILDRFISYVENAIPIRETDSGVKKKLRERCQRNLIDIRPLHLNTDSFSNTINAYFLPNVVDYSQSDLPKKGLIDHHKVQEILLRECKWDPLYAELIQSESPKKGEKSFAISRHESLVVKCQTDLASCSKREAMALERLRSMALEYQDISESDAASRATSSSDAGSSGKKLDVLNSKKNAARRGSKRRANIVNVEENHRKMQGKRSCGVLNVPAAIGKRNDTVEIGTTDDNSKSQQNGLIAGEEVSLHVIPSKA